MSIKVLHIVPSIGKESFGLGHVPINLAKFSNDLNTDARIWCLDSAEQIDWAIALPGLARDKVTRFHRFPPARLGLSHAMVSAARVDGGDFDIVHQHGIWTACSYVSNTIRRFYRTPTVLAPHGMLHEWALKHSQWKKRLALFAYEHQNLRKAACLHATSETEVSDFRDFGLSNPIAVIPNGASATWLDSHGDGQRFRQKFSIRSDHRILLFLSRITPKKGLPILLHALDRIRNDFSDWQLVIAGSDEFCHLQEVASLVAKLKLENLILFTGPLYDQAKRDAFAASDAFVLPSHSEGAPMVVLDSLATGVPVITTKVTPWKDLETLKCGWWVEATVDGLIKALQGMLASDPEKLKVMGQRGRELVKSQYLWSVQAVKTIGLYEWLLRLKPKPDFVITD
jgi:glycosyltransferase involved in cell wall biosynthesis